ncbi:Acriflavine sensitivity control protein acr-2 [Lasiodiplodia theobromae]|uniref:Acriflavine sensitivity control protein acr-2 n=1 Tax=Lasiodiplodia theobromae TaxID=45133 RepID=UPI0015C3A12C|nr:Acriflavine sensitivity control protein acr-2 [Lasiodiplodia theobromae]KAF4533954.1 Acriflavine sensitivity control protein acr-2 [Lasiodiplodia theobromae]
MSSGQDEPPTKPCHNCRRRRLKCDRSLPGCQKCIKTGQECLGYGKLFLWNQGVASRGKMMGKSIPIQTPKPPRRQDDTMAVVSNTLMGPTPSLIDPIFQDLGHSSRLYLSHFADEFCKALVTYDMPNLNPFRDLIPLTREHAVLLHMAIANSAVHMANRYAMETQSAAVTAQSLKGFAVGQSVIQTQPLQVLNGQAARFYHDALVAKQKALQLLRHALQHVNAGNRDVLLAAIHLFANFELITSGKGDCIVHVEGARRLIECFGTESSPMMGKLRDYLISDCLTFYILGSTVVSSRSRANASRHFQYVLPLLERAESNSYLSCPAVLLQIMLLASYLSGGQSTSATEEQQQPLSLEAEAAALLQRAQSFDVHAWAQGVQGISSDHDDFESRVHVASAHKSAICLYIHRAVPTAVLLDGEQTEMLVSDVIGHLALIGRDDNLIKGTAWPTFVAGAETADPARRAWIADRLVMLWRIMLWGYLPTALETLHVIWGTDDDCPNGEAGVREGWLQKLKRLGIEWMIV